MPDFIEYRPFANEHSCRLLDPGKFKADSFRRTKRKHDGKEYSIIMGRLKGETTMTEQAYRYGKKIWSASEAKSHCTDHDGILFEPAKKESDSIKPDSIKTENNNVVLNPSHQISHMNNITDKLIERRFLTDVELRVDDDEGDGNSITGYAARFDVWSEPIGFFSGFKEKIKKGAFKKTIAENDIRALINHDPNHIIGRTKNKTLELWEDDKGLGFNVKLPDTSYAADLKESIRRKDITQNSFGFQTINDEWAKDGKKRTLFEVKLFDVSPVVFPAYKQTSVKLRGLINVGIDYEALDRAIIHSNQGIKSDSDIDLFKTVTEILKRYIPAEEEPLIEIVDDPEHSENLNEPVLDYATQIRLRLVDMMIKKQLGGS